VLRLRVPSDAAATRLDRFLAGRAEIGSRAAAEKLLAADAVRVDGTARAKSFKLGGGETVEADTSVLEREPLSPEEVSFTVLYEDPDLLVVDKPAGVVVHPTPGQTRGTLVHGLLRHGIAGGDADRPGIVHRLDRDTSGLLVVTRSAEAHRAMQALVRRHALEREYLALVRGHPRSRTGQIEAPIGRDRHDPTRHSLNTATPRDAVTHFELERLLGERALLRIRLETGRTHQIRVHLEAIGLPICGDPVYGLAGDLGLERQFLHAARLAFDHPRTGERIDVSSPLPPDLAEALNRAEIAA
jgi:23S rRNA pseudouridine1911/1915/1917 synthase